MSQVKPSMASRSPEIDWDSIDKTKFIVYGLGAFSGVTTLLYPMVVIKTKVQASRDTSSGGFRGALTMARTVLKSEGMSGLYRGYTTIIFGMIPGRMVYLTCLELSKSTINKVGRKLEVPETVLAGVSNTLAGGVASLATQVVVVPIDVVAQRQMVGRGEAATPTASSGQAAASKSNVGEGRQSLHTMAARGGCSSSGKQGLKTAATFAHTLPLPGQQSRLIASSLAAASSSTPGSTDTASRAQRPTALSIFRQIVKEEGFRGLYRGFGASVATFVPSSALWWGSYGVYQKLMWSAVDRSQDHSAASTTGTAGPGREQYKSADGTTCTTGTTTSPLAARSTSQVLAVQTASAVLAGTTSSFLTSPLDLVKTRVQVALRTTTSPLAARSTSQVLAVQTASAVLAGTTSSFLTSPLDLVKTRVQVARKRDGQATTFRAVWGEIIREEGGWKGMFRGAVPRMANAALWGTCMVSTYEFLKRVSKKDPEDL
eukprot:gene11582-34282_t